MSMFESNSGGGMTNTSTENSATEQSETNPLDALVGEGKKFRDVSALVKSLQHKDEFIEQLKGENLELREEVKSRTKLEEAIDRIRSLESNYKKEEDEDNPQKSTSKEVDPERIAQMAIKHLEARQAEERKKQNAETVKKELIALFGEGGYEVALREKMRELNLTEDYVTRLAQETPMLLIDYFKKSVPQKAQAPVGTAGSQVNEGFYGGSAPSGTKRTSKYYEKLKKDNPELYSSSKIQWQMHQDALKMGPAFFE